MGVLGEIIDIFVCERGGQPMESRIEVEVRAGLGIAGDRYALGTGGYSPLKDKRRDITFIDESQIAAANAYQRARGLFGFTPMETRRNVLTRGIDLNSLVWKAFRIGGVVFFGTDRADPCQRPESIMKKAGINKSGFREAFEHRGGLRAQVVTSGIIRVGDVLELIPSPRQKSAAVRMSEEAEDEQEDSRLYA
jgi:MOSC domain-containing protein YiiM